MGNARTALFNWLFARQKKGAFILRIEDTDVKRSIPEYEKKLKDNLRWLSLDWDEGPDIGGRFGPYRQSLRLDIYKSYTQRLLESGEAYYCFCSPQMLESDRKRALASAKMPIYGGRCRSISLETARQRIDAGEKAVVRLRTPGEGTIQYDDLVSGTLNFDLRLIGDPILVRSNGLPAYNYAVVIDDSLMKVTHVIRGEDHISNTPLQILIYKAFSLAPPQFAHLSLVMGKDNSRLSKRHGATSVDQFEKRGILSSALFNYLALLGWAPPEGKEVLTKNDLIKLFNLEKVNRSSAIFDYEKLHWINRQHIKKLPSRQKVELAFPYLKKANIFPEKMTDAHWNWLEKAVESLIERVDRFSELPQQVAMLFEFSPAGMEDEIKRELETGCALRVIKLFGEKISELDSFDYDRFAFLTQEIGQETGCKGKELYHPLRVALTGRTSGLKFDKFINLVEEGAKLNFPKPMKNCAQRVAEMLVFLKHSGL